MRRQWYPATTARPVNAFTFSLLDFFHELTVQGKTSLYDFHHTIARVTDNSGTVAGWVCGHLLSYSATDVELLM